MNHDFTLGACPRCQLQVDTSRFRESTPVCNHCGYTSEILEEILDSRSEMSIIKCMATLTVILVIGFIHVGNWGTHSVSIIPLKVKESLGLARSDDLRQIAHICTEQIRPSCVEKALAGLVAAEPDELENISRLATFQLRINNIEGATKSFSLYFSRGGVSPEAAYNYALALEKSGRINDAARMFEFALISKPDVLQVSVTQSYVHMLMKNRRYSEARKLIESVRKKNANAKYFMAKEYEQLQKARAR